jgi:hypothetical protein
MIAHVALIGGLTAVLVLAVFYPFLPGKYDPLALPLSTMAQAFGATGVLLVLPGTAWLAYELRKQWYRKRSIPHPDRRHYFALASMITAAIPALAVFLVALMAAGYALAFLTLALYAYLGARLIPRLSALKNSEPADFNPAPLYLVVIPSIVLLLQLMLATPAIEFSRNRAIANSSELIHDIEAYRAANGRDPNTLLAVWKDYDPYIVGIEKFHYAPQGDAYNLFFEQPRLLFDNIGTREFVVYNKLDQHVIPSHATWNLAWTFERLKTRQGWYTVHDAASPHWKYFWFD